MCGTLLESVPLRNTRFAEADLRGASTGRELAHGLASPPRLSKQGALQDPRQDLTSGRAESENTDNGTADGIRGSW